MAAGPVWLLSAAAARDLFRAVDAGSTEVLGALDRRPLLVVEDPDPSAPLDVPPALPCVVAAEGPEPAGLDLALGTDRDLKAVTARVGACPLASVTLVHMLRAGPRQPVEAGLLRESLAYSTLQAGPEHARWRRGRPAPAETADSEPPVEVMEGPDRLTVVLNRPRVRNAYSAAMRDALCAALADACAGAATTTVELRGRGPAFCSGGDLAEFGSQPDPASAHLTRTTRSAGRLLDRLAGRTVARVHGACAGAGAELPAFAGRVEAAEDTVMWLPEIAMGLIPGAGGTVSIPRRIGAARTAWMALTGQPVDAPTALSWGLVDAIV